MNVTKKYIIFTITGIMLLLASIILVSYAFMPSEVVQEESNIFTTLDCMDIKIEGTNAPLNLNSAYPLSDNQGKLALPYNFQIINNCNTYVEYYLVMSVMDNSTLTNEEYIKVSLDGNKNLRPSTLNVLEKETGIQIMDNTLNNYILLSDNFNGSQMHEYNFRMWLNAANDLIWTDESIANQILNVKLSVIGVSKNNPDLLLLSSENNEDSLFLNGPLKRNEITEIHFVNHHNIPEGSTSWDVTSSQNKIIMAWYELIDDAYKVTIGQINGVNANHNSSYLFSNMPNLKRVDLTHFNTKYVNNMEYLFYNSAILSNELELTGIELLDTSNVRDLTGMFSNLDINTANYTLDLSSWNTSNALNTPAMFKDAKFSGENSIIDLRNWDISYIKNMDNMFDSAIFNSLRLDNWENASASNELMFNNVDIVSKVIFKEDLFTSWLND